MPEKKSVHLMEAGEELEPFEFLVTPELNQQYLYAEEDYHPRYLEKNESGPPLVHPALLLNMSNSTRSPSFYLAPGWAAIHAAEETEFLNPARVGKKLRVTWRIVETYEKRGKPWRVTEALVVDEDGVQILRRKLHSTYSSSESAK
ncbi:MAG: hypothetical protein PWP65_1367 [Clostridia bacterium]|nr:hypothetical protein [Clostridia bacterium]